MRRKTDVSILTVRPGTPGDPDPLVFGHMLRLEGLQRLLSELPGERLQPFLLELRRPLCHFSKAVFLVELRSLAEPRRARIVPHCGAANANQSRMEEIICFVCSHCSAAVEVRPPRVQ
jgi:hypothetical protein